MRLAEGSWDKILHSKLRTQCFSTEDISLSLSVSISVCLSVCLFVSLSPPLCLCLSVSLSFCLSVSVCLSVCLSLSVSLSHSLSLLFIFVFLSSFFHPQWCDLTPLLTFTPWPNPSVKGQFNNPVLSFLSLFPFFFFLPLYRSQGLWRVS